MTAARISSTPRPEERVSGSEKTSTPMRVATIGSMVARIPARLAIGQEGNHGGNQRGEAAEEKQAEGRRSIGEFCDDFCRTADEPGSHSREEKRPGGDGIGGITTQRDGAENAVEAVAKAGAETDQKTGQREPAAGETGDKNAAKKGKRQGQKLPSGQLLMEEKHGHQHDPDGGGIEKDCGRGERHHVDGGEVAGGEKEYASYTEAEKERQIPGRNAEARWVAQKLDQAEKDRGQGQPDRGDLDRGEATGCEPADKNPHAAPEDARQDDESGAEDRRIRLFHVLCHFPYPLHSPAEEGPGRSCARIHHCEGKCQEKARIRDKQEYKHEKQKQGRLKSVKSN